MKVAELEAKGRENRAKAETIENAIYDIKAVNQNAKDTTDRRTPAELIAFIKEKSLEVESTLAKLVKIS